MTKTTQNAETGSELCMTGRIQVETGVHIIKINTSTNQKNER